MEVKEKQRHNEQIPYHPPFRTLCVSSPLFLFVRPCTRVGYARSPPSSELELVLLLPYYYYYHHHTPFTYYTPLVLIPVLGVLYYFEPSTPSQITNKAAFAVLKIERQNTLFASLNCDSPQLQSLSIVFERNVKAQHFPTAISILPLNPLPPQSNLHWRPTH